MKNAILIVTHQEGFESDPVIDELRRRGKDDVFRFNGNDGDNVSLISFSPDTEEIHLACDGRRVRSADISAGWCQQLPPYLGQPSDDEECLQRENLTALQFSTWALLPVRWFNNPMSVLCASNKVLQLNQARSVGLSVPQTLVSNDSSIIRSFARDKVVVAKNLATPWVVSQTMAHAAYTRIVDQSWLADDKALSFAPVIYQEYKERRRDFRVVVVDKEVFAASCTPKSHQREDIRIDETGESFQPCDFDARILRKLYTLMNALKINYCAADFIEDRDGNIFFLEVNTCGTWWWVDQLYNGAICNSIADALITRAGNYL